MKRIIVSLLALMAFSILVSAKGDWKGKVLDENGEPMAYANVALLSSADSTVVGGTTTDIDGTFSIVSERKDVIVMVSMIGYETAYLSPSEGQIVTLKPDMEFLGEAIVSAVMPKTKLTGEGLQTSVRGSVLENIGTANDVLARTPGLIDGQNGLEVIGRGNPVIYINGHKVSDSGELSRLLSNEIQSVEVISNPGAQYDASVTAVVRIKTIRRQGDGFGFNTGISDEQATRSLPVYSSKGDMFPYNDPSFNFNANYRHNNVDIFGGVNLFKFTSTQTSDLYQETYGEPGFVQDGNLFNEYTQKTIALNFGSDWQIKDSHSVGFKLDYGNDFSVPSHQVLIEKFYRNGECLDDISTVGDYKNLDKNPQKLSANAYYNGQAGKLGIDFNADYYGAYDGRYAKVNETSTMIEDSVIETNTETKANMFADKLVLSYPIWQGMFQTGTEETFTRMSDDYTIAGTFIPSSSSSVKEDNIAAFASYGFVLEKLGQFSAGLRYEHVNYEYNDLKGDGSFTRNYDNFFPSLSYAGAFGPVQAMLSYSTKTARPDFSMLSSAIRYNSRYVLQSGNAALQPQTIHSVSGTAMYKWLTFIANYNRVDDAIVSWSRRYNDSGVVLVRPENLEKPFRQLSTFVNATPTIGIWTMNYTVGLQQQWLTIKADDPREASGVRETSFSNKPMFIAQLNNTLSFKHGWMAELNGEYHSKAFSQNIYLTNNYLDLTAAIQKTFLKDESLVVRLQGNDIAGLGFYNVRADFGGHLVEQTNKMATQRVILSIRYRFNSASSKYKGTGAGADVKDRM